MAAEKKREERRMPKYKKSGGASDVKGEEKRRVEKAESVKRLPPTKRPVPEYCLSFAEIALLPVNGRARKKIESIL